MATLEKIRSKGLLLLIVIGSALLCFIIGDFMHSGSSYFNQSKMDVVKIGGESVKISEYQAKIDELTKVYQIQMNQTQLSEEMTDQLRQSAFDNIVREKLIQKSAEKVGIAICSKELFDMVSGNNIHPYIQSLKMFYNPNTGVFDKSYLLNFLKSLESTPQNQQQKEQIDQAKTFWLFWENLIKNSKLEEKYVMLLTKSLNTNSLEAKYSFENRKNTVSLTYVLQPYTSIPDSKITVTDGDLKKQYDSKKEHFKQEASRDLRFISFSIKPSKDDYAKIEDWINKQKTEFTTSADVSDLLDSNSDIPFPKVNSSEKDLDPDFKAFALSGKKNDVSALMLVNNNYKMARIVENDAMAPDSVKIRHIFIAEKDEATTKTLSDSIMKALKEGADFKTLAKKYSKNKNTAQNGGEVGWVKEANVEKEMIKPCFYTPSEKLFAVKTNNGTQIVEILDKTKNVRKVKLAILERNVSASSTTYSKIYNDAKQYIAKNNTAEKFESAAQKAGYVVRPYNNIGENDPKLGAIKDSRKVIRWAFENEKGTISDVFVCGEEFIVASIKTVNEKGYKALESVKEELKAQIILDKKAEIITNDLTEKLNKSKTLQDLSSVLSRKVDTLANVNFMANRTSIGEEPAILAIAPLLKKNELSKPIKGKAGVFVLNVFNINASNATYNDATEKMQLNARFMYTVPQSVIEVLKEKEGVTDNRSRFF